MITIDISEDIDYTGTFPRLSAFLKHEHVVDRSQALPALDTAALLFALGVTPAFRSGRRNLLASLTNGGRGEVHPAVNESCAARSAGTFLDGFDLAVSQGHDRLGVLGDLPLVGDNEYGVAATMQTVE